MLLYNHSSIKHMEPSLLTNSTMEPACILVTGLSFTGEGIEISTEAHEQLGNQSAGVLLDYFHLTQSIALQPESLVKWDQINTIYTPYERITQQHLSKLIKHSDAGWQSSII